MPGTIRSENRSNGSLPASRWAARAKSSAVNVRNCMVPICRVLTSMVLVVHFTLGCCAHHAHASESTAVSAETHDHALSEHGHQDCPSHQPASNSHDCKGERCSFVLPAASPVIGELIASSLHLPAAILGEGACAATRLSSGAWTDRAMAVPLPVRLHLVHQILLI